MYNTFPKCGKGIQNAHESELKICSLEYRTGENQLELAQTENLSDAFNIPASMINAFSKMK